MHALDNVIWQSLTTRHAHFAESFGQARRFIREVTSLSGFAEESADGYAALAGLVGVGGTAALFLDSEYKPRSRWELLAAAPLLQMVCEDGKREKSESVHEIVRLGARILLKCWNWPP